MKGEMTWVVPGGGSGCVGSRVGAAMGWPASLRSEGQLRPREVHGHLSAQAEMSCGCP